MALEALLASVLVPAAIDMVKGIGGAVSRRFGGLSVDDEIKLNASHVEKLKAVAELDNPHGTPSQWVIDLRGAFRYVAAGALIVAGGFVMVTATDPAIMGMGAEIAAMPFGFIFGERMVLSFKGGKTK